MALIDDGQVVLDDLDRSPGRAAAAAVPEALAPGPRPRRHTPASALAEGRPAPRRPSGGGSAAPRRRRAAWTRPRPSMKRIAAQPETIARSIACAQPAAAARTRNGATVRSGRPGRAPFTVRQSAPAMPAHRSAAGARTGGAAFAAATTSSELFQDPAAVSQVARCAVTCGARRRAARRRDSPTACPSTLRAWS